MKFRYLALLLAWPLTTLGQTPTATALFQDEAAGSSPLAAALAHTRPLVLDGAAARATLSTAPPENQLNATPLVLALPLPDGSSARFTVWQTAVMEPALAAKFPDIKTYAGQGLDDATATLRLDLTPAGFHAQVISARTGSVYIDPARRGDLQHYLCFYGRDQRASNEWQCAVPPPVKPAAANPPARQRNQPGTGGPAAIASGGVLRTYRLAVAATGEYSDAVGGTVPLAMAAIVTSVNRVVGILETELAVRLVLVANNTQVVYLDAATDPYTGSSLPAMVPENQVNLDAVIGSANYDIGHVFSTAGGGLAGLGVVGVAGQKARAASGSNPPTGPGFEVHVVAHEMGHQFGGNHSFNGTESSCLDNRYPGHAWEPGSGSTIMSYAGNCGSQNIQYYTDPVYHVGNFDEMRTFILSTTAPTLTATANTPPVVSGPPSGLTLPLGTPFKLTATATDAEADPLTYRWEEIDRGSAGAPADPQVANDNWPLFRSFLPSTSPTRYFPQLSEVVNNTVTLGEQLPLVARRLTFKCRASDAHRGPAGVVGGVTSSDSVKLRVSGTAGPFLVTSPNTGLAWAGGSTQTVAWNVAGTTANGVNCALVNVLLSTDGGFNYPTILATRVPNSGSATVRLPAVASTTARIMVEAADNYFFDISNANFTISSPSVCAPPTALAVSNITNTGARASFTAAPGAVRYVVTTTPASTTQTVTTSPVNLTGLLPGTAYTVRIATECSASSSVAATANFTTTAPPQCYPPTELAVTNRTTTTATLSFVGTASASSYTITTVPATTTRTVTASPVSLTGLAIHTTYTVRVVANCAGGGTAATVQFHTLAPPPPNDLCANALPLTCGIPVTCDTESATATGDPTLTCVETVDGGGVFYTIVGTGNSITLTTCAPTVTNYDTKLFVYQGACSGPFTCITGNDDTRAGGCGEPSTVTFASVRGVSYLVFVSGYAGATGTFRLLATCVGVSAKTGADETVFRVWPNPVGGHAALQIALAAPAASATAILRNVLGQRVGQRTFSGSTTELSTAGLAPGIYLLAVRPAGQAPAVRRVVVE